MAKGGIKDGQPIVAGRGPKAEGKPKGAAPRHDWAAIEADYRAGQMTMANVAKKHGVNPRTLATRATREAWGGGLAAAVRVATDDAVIYERAKRVRENGIADGLQVKVDAVAAAAQANLTLILEHGRNLTATRELVVSLVDEAGGMNRMLREVSREQMVEVAEAVGLSASQTRQILESATLGSRASVADRLANALGKLIPLERMTAGIDKSTSVRTFEDYLEELASGA